MKHNFLLVFNGFFRFEFRIKKMIQKYLNYKKPLNLQTKIFIDIESAIIIKVLSLRDRFLSGHSKLFMYWPREVAFEILLSL